MLRVLLLGAALCAAILACPVAAAQDANALRARHAALREQLADNPFGRPVHVESGERSGEQKGEIFAVLEEPYSVVGPALRPMESWCAILMLQVNVKRCDASSAAGADRLTLFVTRKPRDGLKSAHRVDLTYEAGAASADYLHVALRAPSGPLDTTNYRIQLEAAPLDAQRTFVHMAYAYGVGIAARLAMQGYLATSGRNKVGFSVVERLPDGRPVFIAGMRGVVERSAMRHYLAVEAYLASLKAPAPERLEKRLRGWYAAIERYPLQLGEEVRRDEYVEMKREEVNRQLDGGAASGGR